MNITKYITIEQEIEVDISIDDLISEIISIDAHDCMDKANRILSICVTVIKLIPDSLIEKMTESQKKIISANFKEQIERYNGVASENREAFSNSLASKLYHVYGVSRNWTRSEGKPMDIILRHAPDECQISWRAVAAEAIKIIQK